MTIGTEHEYSINDMEFNPRPVSDQIIKKICGRVESEILFGDVKLSKELQKTVLEFIPKKPEHNLAPLEEHLYNGIRKFSNMFHGKYQLLGLGMHPTLTLDRTAVWDHDEGDYYEVYDRLFDIRQHGWLNIQALQINLSYAHEHDLVCMHNRIRALLPCLVAVTASSPMVEGRLTGNADNRLIYYRENQKEIPRICNRIIPGQIREVADYHAMQQEIFSSLRECGAGILCEEWVNSSGIIIRFSRRCLEIKALDEQECIRSDMAVCAFVRALLRCSAPLPPIDHEGLISLLEEAVREGTRNLRPELEQLYACAWQHATDEERTYLPVIRNRIENGSLAERMRDRYENEGDIVPIMNDMARCLLDNHPYGM
ncbi:MAG: glutamate-cysteine ligase family protein [Methanoregula sp.]|nr:MAG: glutamate-cysteine ligase family protein [Methanoregula sp.]